MRQSPCFYGRRKTSFSKKYLVFNRSGFSCRHHPYGRSSPYRTFVLTDSASHTGIEINKGSFDLDGFPVSSQVSPRFQMNGLRRRGAMFFTDDAGAVFRPGKARTAAEFMGPLSVHRGKGRAGLQLGKGRFSACISIGQGVAGICPRGCRSQKIRYFR